MQKTIVPGDMIYVLQALLQGLLFVTQVVLEALQDLVHQLVYYFVALFK